MALQQNLLGGAGEGSLGHIRVTAQNLQELSLRILFLKKKLPTKLGPEAYSNNLINLYDHLQNRVSVWGKEVWSY